MQYEWKIRVRIKIYSLVTIRYTHNRLFILASARGRHLSVNFLRFYSLTIIFPLRLSGNSFDFQSLKIKSSPVSESERKWQIEIKLYEKRASRKHRQELFDQANKSRRYRWIHSRNEFIFPHTFGVIEFPPSFLHTWAKIGSYVHGKYSAAFSIVPRPPITFINRLSKYPNNEWYYTGGTKRFQRPSGTEDRKKWRAILSSYRSFFIFIFFCVSKSNLKIHRTQLRLIKFQILNVFDRLRFFIDICKCQYWKKKEKKRWNKIK